MTARTNDEHIQALQRLRDAFDAFGAGPANTQDIAALDFAIAAVNELPRLLDRVAAAERDAARLDWLEANAMQDDGGYGLPFVQGWVGPVPKEWAESLRAAIDAALAAKERP